MNEKNNYEIQGYYTLLENGWLDRGEDFLYLYINIPDTTHLAMTISEMSNYNLN